MQMLDVRDPNQVGSVTQIEADLGAGALRLLVLSGIAMTDWEIDYDDVQRRETEVKLGVFASALVDASAFVGLASIANDETGFVFAVDSARVWLAASGELMLTFNSALMGEPSALHRVSYQVVATVAQVTPYIAGTIAWPNSLFKPSSNDVSAVEDQLEVMANRHERITPDSSLAYDKLTPVPPPGQIVRFEIISRMCVAHYLIENPLMAVPLKVTVKTGPKFSTPPPGNTAVGRVAGPDVFTLTGSAPSVEGLNFAIGVVGIR